MRFWIAEKDGEIIACQFTKKQVVADAKAYGLEREEISVSWVECEVNAETVRRLLGNYGGYATNSGGGD